MAESRPADARGSIADNLYDVDSSDPRSELVDRSGMRPEEVAQIGRLMHALSSLRKAEERVSEASQEYMRLSAQDMRALHYLIVAKNRGELVTPGMIAAHLAISPASTTKLLNRLERAGHVLREVHPRDRRAFSIRVTQSTEFSAMQSVGMQQAKRFNAAARLTPAEREIVIRFFEDMAQELSMDGVVWEETPRAR